MGEADCADFLQWALPRLGHRWAGFRRVKGQVCKRLRCRIAELGLSDLRAYRARLEVDPAEWAVLDGFCFITISRFLRDRGMWEALREDVLPTLARAALSRSEDTLRVWSLGCASGEEPHTMSIVWRLALAPRFPPLRLRVLGTDVDETVLHRARLARYPGGTLRELPSGWREKAFERTDDLFVLRDPFREPVELRREDVRTTLPDETFSLVFCRNVVLTYLEESRQPEALARILSRLEPGGAFVIGSHEKLPEGAPLEPWHATRGIYRQP